MPVFSIITVCLNAEQCIRETIQSVLNQTSTNFEYIIKDGLSSDKTVNIAQSFTDAFAQRGISYRIISRKDSGIYDAMNQAVQETKGEWINFMNAGDRFATPTILDQVERDPHFREADIVYGDSIRQDQQLFQFSKARNLEYFRLGLPFCHQSCFTKRDLFKNRKYSTKLVVNSDYLFYSEYYKENKRFIYVPIPISIIDANGISSNWRLTYPEKLNMLEKMPIRDEDAIQSLKKVISRQKRKEFMHKHLWRFIPKGLREKRRKLIKKKAGWKTEEEFFGIKKGDI